MAIYVDPTFDEGIHILRNHFDRFEGEIQDLSEHVRTIEEERDRYKAALETILTYRPEIDDDDTRGVYRKIALHGMQIARAALNGE